MIQRGLSVGIPGRNWALAEFGSTVFGQFVGPQFADSVAFAIPLPNHPTVNTTRFEEGGYSIGNTGVDDLTRIIMEKSRMDACGVLLLEDSVGCPEDPVLATEPEETFEHSGTLVRYCLLPVIEPDILKSRIYSCDRSFRLVGAFSALGTRPTLPKHRGVIPESLFSSIVSRASFAFASAYDGEGFICLERRVGRFAPELP